MSIPVNWETGGGVKVERAKEHIRNLEAEIEAFEQRRPCEVVADPDKQARALVLRLKINEFPPLRWGAVAGDAIHNLRAALDVLWRAVIMPGRSERTEFFIYDSAKEFVARQRRVIHSSRKNAVEVYRALKPYKGGNDALWRLHRLDIADKHHVLLPVLFLVFHNKTHVNIRYRSRAHVDREALLNPRRIDVARVVYAPEDGTELGRVHDPVADVEAEINVHSEFTSDVALGETEIVEPEPIITTLHKLTGVVESVVEAFSLAGPIVR